jgi:hypothetical protein
VFQNAAGQPQPNSMLDCVFECGEFSMRLAQVLADSAGRVSIDVPTEVVSVIRYQPRHTAGSFEPGTIEVSPGDKGWRPHVVRMIPE